MKKISILIPTLLIAGFCFAQTPPPLVWHQDYGTPEFDERITAVTLDDADNFYVAGYVYEGNYGNVLINKYDALGNIKWNRIYTNTYPSKYPDMIQLLAPDNLGGATGVGYMHLSKTIGHIIHYNRYGFQDQDYFFGDTSLGNTLPVAYVVKPSGPFFILGKLSGYEQVFKIDSAGNIKWYTALNNNYNPNVAQLQLDGMGNIVAGVFDSISATIRVRRYAAAGGKELSGFNTGIDSLPGDTLIKMAVDASGGIFFASVRMDSAGQPQMAIHKFDTLGNALWTTLCPNDTAHLAVMANLILDKSDQVLASATYTRNTVNRQFAAVYKIDNATGNILWTTVDTGGAAFMNDGLVRNDTSNNVYMGTSKAQTINSGYTQLSFSMFSADSGKLQWNRSFDNLDSNNILRMRLNSSGDVFFACNTLTDTLGDWFIGRVGNNAGDVAGIDGVSKDDNGLKVYPNPFNGLVNVGFVAEQGGDGLLKIFNVEGQQMYIKEVSLLAGNNKIQLTPQLSPGVYIFKLETAQGSFVHRAVVY